MTAQEQKSYKAGRDFSRALLKGCGLNIAFIQGVEDEISDRWFTCDHCDKVGLQHDPRQEYCTNKCKQAHYRQLKRITDEYNQFFPEGQGNIITGTVDEPVHRGDMIATAVDGKGNIKFVPVQEGGKCGFVRDDKGNEYVVPLKEV